MRVLLTFSGFHDPYCPSVVDGKQQAGPIISMLEARPFDSVLLFNTPGAAKHTAATAEAIAEC